MRSPEVPADISFTREGGALSVRPLRPIDHEYLESLGYEVDTELWSSGWVKLKYDVEEHKDNSNYGRCFVQCSAGSGVLHVWDDDCDTYYKRHLSPGKRVVFNDHNRHSFDVTEMPCILMVVDLKR